MKRLVAMDTDAVRRAYARWAPVYDLFFGWIADAGRKQAVDHINNRHGKVLEVGVGTGITLPRYRRDLKISAIDLSGPMLDRARKRVRELGLANVEAVEEMDAAALEFPDASHDVVVAMYVLTVVPDPEKVMMELERVCAPGGEVIVINHFSTGKGVRGWLEQRLAPLAERLGWRPDFPLQEILVCDRLRLVEQRLLTPFGFFTMLRFVRQTEPASNEVSEQAPRSAPAGKQVGSLPIGDVT